MIWKLIYDNENIIILFETTDITITQHNVYESSLIDNCFNKIDELGYNFEFVYNNQKITFSQGTRTYSDIEI
jgi:hypothetical protein